MKALDKNKNWVDKENEATRKNKEGTIKTNDDILS